MLNTTIPNDQPTFPMNLCVQEKQYKVDPFTTREGRYVGHDGFVIPGISTSSTNGFHSTSQTG